MYNNDVALISLGLDPAKNPGNEELEDALEEALYKESNYFLNRDFRPKLAEKRISKLEPICKLSQDLGIESIRDSEKGLTIKIGRSEDLQDLVSQYNKVISNFKLEITQASSPCDIIWIYTKWKEVFIQFALLYCEVYETTDTRLVDEQKKRISNIDFVELQQELKDDNYSGKAKELYFVLKSQI